MFGRRRAAAVRVVIESGVQTFSVWFGVLRITYQVPAGSFRCLLNISERRASFTGVFTDFSLRGYPRTLDVEPGPAEAERCKDRKKAAMNVPEAWIRGVLESSHNRSILTVRIWAS